ncbi:LPXTG cell wall anchor domain-containing protein [Enterococcus rotai]|uniref:LPXTG cell wall anchor domain-containing protein n=1 Tax=Enterococcus rotai TaxID=118060 RepID=UPI0035C77DA7
MRKIKKNIVVLSSLVILGMLFSLLVLNVRSEASEIGGAVQTNGKIKFYEESSSTEPPVSSKEPPTSSVPEPSSPEKPSPKPKGRYPSTGELVKKSLSISGVAIVLAVLIFFLWKRKKEKDGQGKEF